MLKTFMRNCTLDPLKTLCATSIDQDSTETLDGPLQSAGQMGLAQGPCSGQMGLAQGRWALLRADGPCSGPLLRADGPCSGPLLMAGWPCSGPLLRADGPCSGPLLRADGPCSGPLLRADEPCSGPLLRVDEPCSGPLHCQPRTLCFGLSMTLLMLLACSFCTHVSTSSLTIGAVCSPSSTHARDRLT